MGAPAGLTPATATTEPAPTREIIPQRWRVKQNGANLEVVISHAREEGEQPSLRIVTGRRGQIIEGVELNPSFVERYEAGEEHARSLVTRLSDEAPAGGDAPFEDKFDPADNRVEEVQDYLDTADAEERERVMAAESAGDARVGILNYNPEPLVAPEPSNQFVGGGGQ